MKKNKALRRAIGVLAILGVLAGAMFGARALIDRKRTIPVISVSNIADMWYDSGSSGYGQISQGGVQQVWNDTGKLISKVYVSAGDKVSKGDPLVQYDVSEARLEADNCRIIYEMAKRDLNKAQERLEYIRTFIPNERPEPDIKIFDEVVDVNEDAEGKLNESDSFYWERVSDDNVFIININTDTRITKDTFMALLSYDPKEENPPVDTGEGSEPQEGEDEETVNKAAEPKNFCFRIWANCDGMDSVLIATVRPVMDENARVCVEGWLAGEEWKEEDGIPFFCFSKVYSVDDMSGTVAESAEGIITKVFDFHLERTNAQIPETERYSQREIDNMIREQNDLIRGLKIDVAQAELNWRQARQTAGDGIVR
ncbi:MAG: hypothetical protein II643_00915, partial [Oscillospiraceae bacterium]|nr:hypothetical protein [Oscillospiraceae bacterium]